MVAEAGTAVPDGVGTIPVADRGQTVVARQVISKIATQAAREVTPVTRPRADVDEFRAGTATLELQVEVPYPAPLRQTADRLRAQVINTVGRLAGVRVRRVDIDVRWSREPATRRKPS